MFCKLHGLNQAGEEIHILNRPRLANILHVCVLRLLGSRVGTLFCLPPNKFNCAFFASNELSIYNLH